MADWDVVHIGDDKPDREDLGYGFQRFIEAANSVNRSDARRVLLQEIRALNAQAWQAASRGAVGVRVEAALPDEPCYRWWPGSLDPVRRASMACRLRRLINTLMDNPL